MKPYYTALSLGLIAILSSPAGASAFVSQDFKAPYNAQSDAGVILVKNDDLAEASKAFISKLADDGVGFLQNEDISEAKRKEEFRTLLQRNFDMKTIGRFALGRFWKQATKEQQAEYQSLFEKMIVEVYSRRFGDYNGETLDVASARVDGTTDAIVFTYIIPKNGSRISIDWRVRENNGKMKVVDVIVEGVSMALTQRSDFASVIQRGGGNVDVLLEHLKGGSAAATAP